MSEDDDRTRVQASPYAESESSSLNGWVIVLSGSSSGKMFKLDEAEYTLGRSASANIRLDDEGVSRFHAKLIRRRDGSIRVVDLGSTNGVFVNGESVRDRVLQDGDRLLIGPVTFLKFSYQDELEERFQQQLYESATTDPLTGAFNRRYFVQHLARECSHAVRHNSALCLMMLDIDHFKSINDTLGHPAGDYVLETLGTEILESVRAEDIFCRVGGEEFAIILRDTRLDAACLLAERIRALVEQKDIVYDGRLIAVTISVGVSNLTSERHETPKDLVKEADGYLYHAKQAGRNRVASPLSD